MTIKGVILRSAVVVFLATFTSTAQVQILEEGSGGIMASVGAALSPDVIQARGGFEYNIEGKFALGVNYGITQKDTLFNAFPETEVLPTLVNPYFAIEFVEPDRVMPLTFSIKCHYNYVSGEDKNSDEIIKNSYRHHMFGGGPVMGIRFFLSDAGIIAPVLGYSFNWISYTYSDVVTESGIRYRAPSHDEGMLHDILFGVPLSYMFNDLFGIIADAGLSIRIGGEKPLDFIGSVSVGALVKIN